MPDYKNMSAKEALREAKDASGMTAEEIARAWHLGFTHAAVSRCGGQLFSEPQHDPGAVYGNAEHDIAPMA